MSQNMSQQDLETMINAMPNMIGYWDRDLKCRFANNAYSQWFDMQATDIIGMGFVELAGEALFTLNQPHINGVLAGEAQRFERSLTKVDGSTGHIIGNYIPDFDETGQVRGFSILANDVTELKEAEAELTLAACVFDCMTDAVMITDVNGIILSVNPAFTTITGYASEAVVGRSQHILHSDRHDKSFYAIIRRALMTKGEWRGEVWQHRNDETPYLGQMSIRSVSVLDGEPVRYVSVFNDITGLWHRNEKMKYLAFHDDLTDLPNRALLMERLDQKIINSERDKNHLALMFIDLDGFKDVNDRFGHNAGDKVLKEMANRLLHDVRKSDTVARVGGDEFIYILNSPKDKQDVTDIANRLVESLNKPMVLFGDVIRMGASIGISLFPEQAITSPELINNADRAMYTAKTSGKNRIHFFSEEDTFQHVKQIVE